MSRPIVRSPRATARWWRHTTGEPFGEGMFACWAIHAEARPALETYLGDWIARHLPGYTGMVNFETIGGRIIEAHLRFADQWPDLYGDGWVEALVQALCRARMVLRRHITPDWILHSSIRATWAGTIAIHHPEQLAAIRAMPAVSSVQITFHEDRKPEYHAMPPGGFQAWHRQCFGPQRRACGAGPARQILGNRGYPHLDLK